MDILIACFCIISAIHFVAVEKSAKQDSYAFEIYIKDREYYRDNCSHIKWNQPKIKTYKKTLRSHLPKDCM